QASTRLHRTHARRRTKSWNLGLLGRGTWIAFAARRANVTRIHSPRWRSSLGGGIRGTAAPFRIADPVAELDPSWLQRQGVRAHVGRSGSALAGVLHIDRSV